jgi:hypothetical protein
LRSLDFVICPEADNKWIECFKRVYFSYLRKDGSFGKDWGFINPKLDELSAQQVLSLEWADETRYFSIEWPKSMVEDPKTYQEIEDFMNEWVSEANDTYRNAKL